MDKYPVLLSDSNATGMVTVFLSSDGYDWLILYRPAGGELVTRAVTANLSRLDFGLLRVGKTLRGLGWEGTLTPEKWSTDV
jgi:hypothetical protein